MDGVCGYVCGCACVVVWLGGCVCVWVVVRVCVIGRRGVGGGGRGWRVRDGVCVWMVGCVCVWLCVCVFGWWWCVCGCVLGCVCVVVRVRGVYTSSYSIRIGYSYTGRIAE